MGGFFSWFFGRRTPPPPPPPLEKKLKPKPSLSGGGVEGRCNSSIGGPAQENRTAAAQYSISDQSNHLLA